MRWLVLAAALATAPALAQPAERRFYGRDGGLLGTERPGPGGETRLYDRSGRLEGTTRPGPDGETRLYDRSGALQGTARPR